MNTTKKNKMIDFFTSIVDCYYKFRYGWWGDVKWAIRIWIMWELWGWPKWRRCNQCAGLGVYASEMMSRYGDKPVTCDLCNGRGKIKRKS